MNYRAALTNRHGIAQLRFSEGPKIMPTKTGAVGKSKLRMTTPNTPIPYSMSGWRAS